LALVFPALDLGQAVLFSAGGDGGRRPLEHDELKRWCGGWALPWHRADLGFLVHTHHPGALGLQSVQNCPMASEPLIGCTPGGIKAGNRKNFAIEIASIQRDGKYAYQTGRWTLDQVTKVGGNSVRIFEEQPDGKWLAKVHIYNLY
jgi:hypothetical protein